MSFPRYPKYRESGVAWLGEVPEQWDELPLKHLAIIDNSGCYGGEPEDGGLTMPVATTAQIDPDGTFNVERMPVRSFTPAEVLRYGCKTGNILVVKSSGSAASIISGKAGIIRSETPPFIFSNFLMRLIPQHNRIMPTFLYLLLTSHLTRERIKLMVSTTTYPNIQVEEYAASLLPFPPIIEQSKILAFLEKETAKIDALVEEQRRLIELLKEKRQAVISHAVTKGLDPNAPMKDSGVEWLGEVPEHWQTRRISSLSTKITNGYVGPTRDILQEAGVRYLQSLHIKADAIRFDHPYFVSQEWSDAHAKSILEQGDVLIVQTGDVGQAAVVPPEFEGCNCHALIIVAPRRKELEGAWLSMVLKSDFGYQHLVSIQTGAMHPHLNCGDVKDLFLPLPPIEEQQGILLWICAQILKFDDLLKDAISAIALLEERRSALISAAVTGKIDVRNFTPRQAEATQETYAPA